MGQTTIRLETEVRDQLKTFGAKGETYNDIVRRLMSVAEFESMQRDAREALHHPERVRFVDLDDL